MQYILYDLVEKKYYMAMQGGIQKTSEQYMNAAIHARALVFLDTDLGHVLVAYDNAHLMDYLLGKGPFAVLN